MKIKNYILSAALVFAAGCTSPLVDNTSDIKKQSDGTFLIHREDHRGIYGLDEASLRANASADAELFANTQNMVAIPVKVRSKPVGILGDWAAVEYRFRLVDKNDPAARTVTVPVDVISKPQDVKRRDLYSEILELDDLRKRGLLTNVEFETQKQKILLTR